MLNNNIPQLTWWVPNQSHSARPCDTSSGQTVPYCCSSCTSKPAASASAAAGRCSAFSKIVHSPDTDTQLSPTLYITDKFTICNILQTSLFCHFSLSSTISTSAVNLNNLTSLSVTSHNKSHFLCTSHHMMSLTRVKFPIHILFTNSQNFDLPAFCLQHTLHLLHCCPSCITLIINYFLFFLFVSGSSRVDFFLPLILMSCVQGPWMVSSYDLMK